MDRLIAHEVCEALTCLDGFPRKAAAVEAVLELIVRICKSDEQARWLKRELTGGKHAKWQGPGWLVAVFETRYPASKEEESKPKPFISTDCPYCNGSGWRLSRQVGLYEGVDRCDHRGLNPKPLRLPQPTCKLCGDWGTVRTAESKLDWCQCDQGAMLREEVPHYLEIFNQPKNTPMLRLLKEPRRTVAPKLAELERRYTADWKTAQAGRDE